MATEPVYEVKVKDDSASAQPTLTAEQQAHIEAEAQRKAEAAAADKIEKLKEDLVSSISGKHSRYGDKGPESWDTLHENITAEATEKAVRIAEEKIEKRLEAERKAREDQEKQTVKQQEEAQKREWAQMSAEWAEAVQDGILPDIAKDIKAKLKSGVVLSALSEEEQRDPGLKAYNEARMLHIKLKNEGKVHSFYRTATIYKKQPAGANAPVFGGAPGVDMQQEEYSYDDVKKERMRKFGF